MSIQVAPKGALDEWIARLIARYRVIGPVHKRAVVPLTVGGNSHPEPSNAQFAFREISAAAELALDYTTTILPPKKVFLPQKEVLLNVGENGRRMEAEFDDRPTVLFGMHTCDLHAVLLLDGVFGQGVPDQHYVTRRAATTIVSIECPAPCSESAFCRDMDTWRRPEQFDLHLTDLGDAYAIEVGSEKGAALLEALNEIAPAGPEEQARYEQRLRDKVTRFPQRLDADAAALPGLMTETFRSRMWASLGAQCLGCGTCTGVCPTCFCFDVLDEVGFDLTTGQRVRTWDSCQFEHFALVAGGHDFRKGRAARLRHRFNHKFRYMTENVGRAGCVGCGRCGGQCLVDIEPAEVLNGLQRGETAIARKVREVVP